MSDQEQADFGGAAGGGKDELLKHSFAIGVIADEIVQRAHELEATPLSVAASMIMELREKPWLPQLRAIVYTSAGYRRRIIHDRVGKVKIWEGAIAAVPIEGSYISVWEDWFSFKVRSVDHDLPTGVVEVVVTAIDTDGDYAAEAKKRGVEQ